MRYFVEAFGATGWVRVSRYLGDEETARHLAMLFMCDWPGAVAVVRSEPNDGQTLYVLRDASQPAPGV